MAASLVKGESVNLAKRDSGIVEFRLLFGNGDIDLAVLWEDIDGNTGCLQALGGTPDASGGFGSYGRPPFAYLDKDSRSGGLEVMRFNLVRMDQMRRMVSFAYIYPYDEAGRPTNYTWRDIASPRVEVIHPTDGTRVFELGQGAGKSCTLMDFQADGNGGFTMTPLGDFYRGLHKDIDNSLGWPRINWTSSRK